VRPLVFALASVLMLGAGGSSALLSVVARFT